MGEAAADLHHPLIDAKDVLEDDDTGEGAVAGRLRVVGIDLVVVEAADADRLTADVAGCHRFISTTESREDPDPAKRPLR